MADVQEKKKKRMSWRSIFTPGNGQRRVWDLVEKLYGMIDRLQEDKDTRDAMIDELRKESEHYKKSLEEADSNHQDEVNNLQNEIYDLVQENRRMTEALRMATEMSSLNTQNLSFLFVDRPGADYSGGIETHPMDMREIRSNSTHFHPDIRGAISAGTIEISSPVCEVEPEFSTALQGDSSEDTAVLPVAPVTKILPPRVMSLHESPLADPTNFPGARFYK